MLGPIGYLVKGNNPKLLIRAGSHGDEYEVIEVLKSVISAYESRLPDFVFIPEVSPSAVARKTRFNARGIDLNRSFVEGASDPETLANMEIAKNYHFDLCLDFHEDPGTDGFYVYDSGFLTGEALASLRQKIGALGVELFSGVDDPSDPALALTVEGGYLPDSLAKMGPSSGMFEIWAMRHGYLKRCLVPEIPGKLPLPLKQALVNLIFDEIVFGLLQ